MNKIPKISVIFPVYNAANTVKESLNSILTQTFTDFEVIAIDDGSTDNSSSIIESIDDDRIKLYRNDKNRGLVYTLNRGINLSKAIYVARMDSDDICMQDRFEKQVKYLDSNPNVVICGTFAQIFIEDSNGVRKNGKLLKYEIEDKLLKQQLAYECCFAHPTVMMRRSIFESGEFLYDEKYLNGEDYKLWVDLMGTGLYHNIPEVLLKYRVSSTQMSSNSDATTKSSNECRWCYLQRTLSKEDFVTLKKIGINRLGVKFIKHNGYGNTYLLKMLYLSFPKYSLYDILYYVTSLDLLRMSFHTTLSLFKRFLKAPLPLIY